MNKPQRIGIVLTRVPGYSETFLVNKIVGLQNQGIEVILFVDQSVGIPKDFICKIKCMPYGDPLKWKRYFKMVLSIWNILFSHPQRSYKLFRMHRKSLRSRVRSFKNVLLAQPLLNESLDWLHFGFGVLAVNREFVAKVIGASMAVSFRGYDLYLSPLKQPDIYKELFATSCRYHVLSQEMRLDLTNQGVNSNQIEVIYPAIDVDFFRSEVDDIVFSYPIKFLSVTRLHWKKGLEYTLEALAHLKNEGIDFKYTIIGEGDQYERLVFAVHQLDLVKEVRFLGKQSPAKVKQAYKEADIYLQYSIQEGFCNAVLEAQAMGIPCVVSNAEGLAENILDGKTGWVIPKRVPIILANKIKEILLMDVSKLTEIRNMAKERVSDKFNMEAQQRKFVEFYKR